MFYYKVSPFPDLLALTYTKMYDPALNLDNDSRETEDFRKKLIASRNNHVEKADYDKVKTKASTMRLPKTGKDLESALNEAMADNAARIPDKMGIASIETLIAYQGHEEEAIALVYGGVNDYGEKKPAPEHPGLQLRGDTETEGLPEIEGRKAIQRRRG